MMRSSTRDEEAAFPDRLIPAGREHKEKIARVVLALRVWIIMARRSSSGDGKSAQSP